MQVTQFTPPWRSLEKYVEARVEEARLEARLALRFLEEGLLQNAAGKAFQAWKAVLAALAASHREVVAEKFRGVVVDKLGKKRERADLIIALMPTTKMRAVAELLAERTGWEVVYLTDLALNLHDFQYNGLDPERLGSRYGDVEEVARDLKHLVEKTFQMTSQLFK
ncbi:MAG: PaREP1 family protein [Pyrobaculum sp.]